jgi:REP element-mobilizing transposase RayT
MTHNPDVHHRRSIRLRDFDYATAGAYFVTVCTQGRECLFGRIDGETMVVNGAGNMMEMVWQSLPNRFPSIVLDAFMVMPNHVHFIVFLVGAPLVVAHDSAPHKGNAQNTGGADSGGHKTRPYGETVTDVIGAFKSITTHQYTVGVKQNSWPAFPGRLWQRNYYERIVRNEGELNGFREYIQHNPAQWADDEENIARRGGSCTHPDLVPV